MSNIFRINKESHIDKFLIANEDNLTMILFCEKKPSLSLINIFMKRHLAVKYPECKFIMVLVNDIINDTNTYVKELVNKRESLPFVVFFYDKRAVAKIENADRKMIEETIELLLEKMKQIQNNTQAAKEPSEDDLVEHNKKMLNDLARVHQLEQMEEMQKIHEMNKLELLAKLKKSTEPDNDTNNSESESENESSEEDSEPNRKNKNSKNKK